MRTIAALFFAAFLSVAEPTFKGNPWHPETAP